MRFRRLRICVAAIAGAAVTVPVSALAAPWHGAGPPAATAVRPCRSSGTQPWIGLGNGENFLGISYYPLEFTSTGRAACSFYGYPTVWPVTAGGRQVGPAGSQGGSRHRVVLQPGQTGHVILASSMPATSATAIW